MELNDLSENIVPANRQATYFRWT